MVFFLGGVWAREDFPIYNCAAVCLAESLYLLYALFTFLTCNCGTTKKFFRCIRWSGLCYYRSRQRRRLSRVQGSSTRGRLWTEVTPHRSRIACLERKHQFLSLFYRDALHTLLSHLDGCLTCVALMPSFSLPSPPSRLAAPLPSCFAPIRTPVILCS